MKLNAPPGATIATLAGGVFAVAALARHAPRPARRVALAGAGACLLALAGCGSSDDPGGSGGGASRVDVIATTTQLGDFARAIGAGAADVHQILKPNTDPHDYEPRPRDVQDTAGAKLVFESGDKLDAWMGKVVSQSGGSPR